MTKTRTANTDRIHGQVRGWMESHRDYIKSAQFDADVQNAAKAGTMKTWADWVFVTIGPNCAGRETLTTEEEQQITYETAGLVNAIANDLA